MGKRFWGGGENVLELDMVVAYLVNIPKTLNCTIKGLIFMIDELHLKKENKSYLVVHTPALC